MKRVRFSEVGFEYDIVEHAGIVEPQILCENQHWSVLKRCWEFDSSVCQVALVQEPDICVNVHNVPEPHLMVYLRRR